MKISSTDPRKVAKSICDSVCGGTNTVVLPIGLPGSGKSTLVNELRKEAGQLMMVVHSVDDLIVEVHGEYNFVQEEMGWLHCKNIENFRQSLEQRVPLIVVDNTNLRPRERKKYVRGARRHGYDLCIILVGDFNPKAAKLYAKRNKHGIDEASMLNKLGRVNLPSEDQIFARIITNGHQNTSKV